MKTSLDVGARLQEARTSSKARMKDLVDRTGLTAVTVRRALDSCTDARISTVMAIAHELGLEPTSSGCASPRRSLKIPSHP